VSKPNSFDPIFASHAGSILKSKVLKTYKQDKKEKGRAPNYTADSNCPNQKTESTTSNNYIMIYSYYRDFWSW